MTYRRLFPDLAPLVVVWCALSLLTGCGEDPLGFEFDESAPIDCQDAQQLILPSPGALYHGVFPGGASGEEDDVTPAALLEYEAAVDRTVAWVYFSNNWYRDRAFPLETVPQSRRRTRESGGAIE